METNVTDLLNYEGPATTAQLRPMLTTQSTSLFNFNDNMNQHMQRLNDKMDEIKNSVNTVWGGDEN